MHTASSSPNIAFIKYWGNRNNELRLPYADSLSMVLDCPTVRTTVQGSDHFSVQSFDKNGIDKPQNEKSVERIKKHWMLTKNYLETIGRATGLPDALSIVIHSEIPPAIGIASSAAVFSCLAESFAALVTGDALTREQVGIIGRLGSGSAGRNSFGGFVALENHSLSDEIGSCSPRQIAPETHWSLHDIILVPSHEEKKVGSTEGHTMAHTSPLFKDRVQTIPRRMTECIDAILARDFEKLQHVSEEDSLDMHTVMQTQVPSLQYLSDETHRILREVESLRQLEHLEVFYTMDAGPTVHLICTEAALSNIQEYAYSNKTCTIFESKIGRGSEIMKN
jgi:diphosphomevalonate decarboxylase